MQCLGTLQGGTYSYASGVSADGTTVIGSADVKLGDGSYQKHAFVWAANGGMRDFGTSGLSIPPQPMQVLDSGDAAVGKVAVTFNVLGVWTSRAVVWKSSDMQPTELLLPGGTYSYASGVSADGSTVIGSADVLVNGRQ